METSVLESLKMYPVGDGDDEHKSNTASLSSSLPEENEPQKQMVEVNPKNLPGLSDSFFPFGESNSKFEKHSSVPPPRLPAGEPHRTNQTGSNRSLSTAADGKTDASPSLGFTSQDTPGWGTTSQYPHTRVDDDLSRRLGELGGVFDRENHSKEIDTTKGKSKSSTAPSWRDRKDEDAAVSSSDSTDPALEPSPLSDMGVDDERVLSDILQTSDSEEEEVEDSSSIFRKFQPDYMRRDRPPPSSLLSSNGMSHRLESEHMFDFSDSTESPSIPSVPSVPPPVPPNRFPRSNSHTADILNLNENFSEVDSSSDGGGHHLRHHHQDSDGDYDDDNFDPVEEDEVSF